MYVYDFSHLRRQREFRYNGKYIFSEKASGSSFSALEVMMTIGPRSRSDRLFRLIDIEFHLVQFPQQIVWELQIGFIDLVDQ